MLRNHFIFSCQGTEAQPGQLTTVRPTFQQSKPATVSPTFQQFQPDGGEISAILFRTTCIPSLHEDGKSVFEGMLLNVLFYATVFEGFQLLFSACILLMCMPAFQMNFENVCDSGRNQSELMPGWQKFDQCDGHLVTNHFSPFWPMATSPTVNFGHFYSRIF